MSDTPEKSPLQRLAHYRIEAFLGEGAYAEVYRAVDERMGRTVALKVLKPIMVTDADALRRFLQEARLAGDLFHQRLAVVLDAGEDGGHYYLAMRFVDGPNLAQFLAERGPLPWEEALRLPRQIAEGLTTLHERGLVHRDLKPQNILLEKGKDVVLTDFGLARALHASGLSTKSSAFVGTPAYIPPEVWEGQKATPAADQYALACIVAEMLTGKVLYDGPTTPAVMRKHFAPPPLPERWPEGVPEGLDAVLRKALTQDPAERYPDVMAFVEALEGLGAARKAAEARAEAAVKEEKEEPAPAAPAPRPAAETAAPPKPQPRPPRPSGEPRARRPKALWGGLALALALALVLVGALALRHRRSTALPVLASTPIPSGLARITASNAANVRELARWDVDTSVSSVAFSPDGTLLALGAEDGTVRLWRVSDGALVRTLEGHTDWVSSVAFSPDGTLLVSGAADGTVRLWRVSDGTLVRTLKGHRGLVSSVAFSPDGTLLASGAGWWGGIVQLWRVSDGALIRTLEGHTDWVSSVAFSPDGTLLASGAADGTVRLWRVSDGALVRTLGGHTDWARSVAFSPDGTLLASGAGDGTVQLWQVSDGALMQTLEGSRSVAFSPDGTLLASGAADGTVRLWRVSDGALVRTLGGHTDWVRSVAFSPDGTLLASGSDDGTVQLWGVPR